MHKEIEEIVGGKVEKTGNGTFLLLERKLKDIDANKIRDYVLHHKSGITPERIGNVFPGFSTPRKSMLFFDTENCGLDYHSPLFMITSCRITDGVDITCLFARDYSEERAVIKYFLDLIKDDTLFTFNGNAFDLPRLGERAKHNGITFNGQGYTPLQDILKSRHVDLLKCLREKVLLPNYRLQTFEKVCLGFSRQNDIPGEKIPAVYNNYLYKGDKKSIDELARVIRHNMIDTISTVAVFAYLINN